VITELSRAYTGPSEMNRVFGGETHAVSSTSDLMSVGWLAGLG
jgi:hypothetical protein